MEDELRRALIERDEYERETIKLRSQLERMTDDRDRWFAAWRVADALADSEQRERIRAICERDAWAARARLAEASLANAAKEGGNANNAS